MKCTKHYFLTMINFANCQKSQVQSSILNDFESEISLCDLREEEFTKKLKTNRGVKWAWCSSLFLFKRTLILHC